MTRRLTFTGPQASDIFDALWMGLCVGRGLTINVDEKQAGQKREDRREDLAVMRALESVSAPAADTVDKLPFFGDKQRVVRADASVDIAQARVDRLVRFINRVPWATDKLDAAERALDFLSAAPEVETPAT